MLYRETGQFKTTYAADQAIFPIFQDRVFLFAIIAFAYIVIPLIASEYLLQAVLIPLLIFAIAAVGLNILTGYAGQLSLGHRRVHGGRRLLGLQAYHRLSRAQHHRRFYPVRRLGRAYRHNLRPAEPADQGILSRGRHAGGAIFPYLDVQSRSLVVQLQLQRHDNRAAARGRGHHADRPDGDRGNAYLLVLTFCILGGLLAKNLVRGRVGRHWMAIRDMDIAAEIIGIRLLPNKLLAFAISSFYCGVAGALLLFSYLGSAETEAFDIFVSFEVLFMIIIGGLGSILGAYLGAAFIWLLPIFLTNAPQLVGLSMPVDFQKHLEVMIFGSLIVVFLIFEPAGLARLWQIGKEKLRRWPFPY